MEYDRTINRIVSQIEKMFRLTWFEASVLLGRQYDTGIFPKTGRDKQGLRSWPDFSHDAKSAIKGTATGERGSEAAPQMTLKMLMAGDQLSVLLNEVVL